jgi:hypothetical protein
MKRRDILGYVETLTTEGRFFFEACVQSQSRKETREALEDLAVTAIKLLGESGNTLEFIKKSNVEDVSFRIQQQYLPLLNWLSVFLLKQQIRSLAKRLGYKVRFEKGANKATILAYHTAIVLAGFYFLLKKG